MAIPTFFDIKANGLRVPKIYPADWLHVEEEWPRRLLHIPTLTSLERKDGNMYGDTCEPSFSILSYTWGRWYVGSGPRLPISGISWTIPAVDERRAFTVTDFHGVIREIGKHSHFLWLDVACIDQENYAVKMDEIGRQAGIFAKASQVYVWLWTLPIDTLQPAADVIERFDVYPRPMSFNNNPGSVSGSWSAPAYIIMEHASNGLMINHHEDTSAVLDILKRLQTSIDHILGDWYFSSLWTLQECFLRRQAVVLSLDAQPVTYSIDGCSVPMDFIMSSLCQLFISETTIPPSIETSEGNVREQAITLSEIRERVKCAGLNMFPFATNPNIQYGMARFRETSNYLDRIYGIMAVYNLRVGAALPGADTSRKYTLDELEDEFAISINARSPLLGQLFLHTDRPPQGRSWKITQQSWVPHSFDEFSENMRVSDGCVIAGIPGGHAQLSGNICPLEQMYSFWKACEIDYKPRGLYRSRVIVDDYICSEYADREQRISPAGITILHPGHETVESLLDVFKADSLVVMQLGEQDVDIFVKTYGLLLYHDRNERSRCKRIGLCYWISRATQGFMKRTGYAELQWTSFEGVFE